MCLLFLYLNESDTEDGYTLILANNRDEDLPRPTGTAAFRGSDSQWIGGVDLQPGREGGTWLGVSKTGRIGCLLNILSVMKPEAKGRGFLVPNFLTGQTSCEEYIETVSRDASLHNAFHLVLLDLSQKDSKIHTLCSKQQPSTVLKQSGFYSCDNGKDPARPWRKRSEGQKKFEQIVYQYGTTSQKDQLVHHLISLLNDKTTYTPDPALAEQFQEVGRSTTGDYIDRVSAINVILPWKDYATRTNTVILVDKAGNCDYFERTLTTPANFENPEWKEQSHRFKIDCVA